MSIDGSVVQIVGGSNVVATVTALPSIGVSPAAHEEVVLLFPDLTDGVAPVQEVRLIPEGCRQVHLADRMVRNGRTPLEDFYRAA